MAKSLRPAESGPGPSGGPNEMTRPELTAQLGFGIAFRAARDGYIVTISVDMSWTFVSDVAVIVPFRSSQPDRIANAIWTRRWWWATRFNELSYVGMGDGGTGLFSKAKAVNRAAEGTEAHTLILADADVYPADEAIVPAAIVVAEAGGWALPKLIAWLGVEATERQLKGSPAHPAPLSSFGTVDDFHTPEELQRGQYRGYLALPSAAPEGPTAGPFCVLSRALFGEAGGMDESFVGWGGEDLALALVLEAIAGPPVERGTVVHLYHQPQRDRLPENEERTVAYLAARGDRAALLAIKAGQ